MTNAPLEAMRLDGRLAVITGAGSGIGRAAAMLFASVGATVVLADIDGAAIDAVAAAIGPAATAVTVDLGEPDAAERLAAAAEAIAPVAIWTNVAGIGATQSIVDATRETYDRIVRINMDATYWACVAAARRMSRHGAGSIVNISSNAADQPIPTLSAYAMTKAAVNMLTRTLAAELGPAGIRVNAVAPGFIATAMTVPAALDHAARKAMIARNAARSPLGLVGEPSDIAHAMLYLASDAGRFVTGQILRVNGGVAMP